MWISLADIPRRKRGPKVDLKHVLEAEDKIHACRIPLLGGSQAIVDSKTTGDGIQARDSSGVML